MFVSKTKSKLFWYDIKVSYRVYEMQYKYAVQVKCPTVQKCKKCSKNQILNVAHGTLYLQILSICYYILQDALRFNVEWNMGSQS